MTQNKNVNFSYSRTFTNDEFAFYQNATLNSFFEEKRIDICKKNGFFYDQSKSQTELPGIASLLSQIRKLPNGTKKMVM